MLPGSRLAKQTRMCPLAPHAEPAITHTPNSRASLSTTCVCNMIGWLVSWLLIGAYVAEPVVMKATGAQHQSMRKKHPYSTQKKMHKQHCTINQPPILFYLLVIHHSIIPNARRIRFNCCWSSFNRRRCDAGWWQTRKEVQGAAAPQNVGRSK